MSDPIMALFDRPPNEWWRYVPCRYCNADRQRECQQVDGPARRPHAPRVRLGLALHATFAGDVLGDAA